MRPDQVQRQPKVTALPGPAPPPGLCLRDPMVGLLLWGSLSSSTQRSNHACVLDYFENKMRLCQHTLAHSDQGVSLKVV